MGLCMLISLLWIPILLKKFFPGNNLSSGTRCHSCFFKEHFLHLISQETLRPKLSFSETRRAEHKEKGACFYAVYFILSSSTPPEWRVFHNELQHKRKDAVISWHWLRYSVKEFTDDLTAPVPSPKK